MKRKVLACAIFAATAVTVVGFPYYSSVGAAAQVVKSGSTTVAALAKPKIEVVFVLDTTSSMSGLIAAAKEKIWSIATTMAQAQSAPEIKMGLVAYRDRGDAYVTKVIDLSTDLDSMYAELMEFRAHGGGDGPESVNAALHDAVNDISWSNDQDTYKVVFLVGDAPPHMDYTNDVHYPQTLALAQRRGIVVNAIQCGDNQRTRAPWREIAKLGAGDYFTVDQAGSAVAVTTPFDADMARLSGELDGTRMYYGSKAELERKAGKVAAARKVRKEASVAAQARRGAYNVSSSGVGNLLGDKELVDDVASGRVELDSVETEQLPEEIRALAPAAQKSMIEETAKKRSKLKRDIQELARQRADFIEKAVEAKGGAAKSLDNQIFESVREQAARKGIEYGAGSTRY